MQRYGMVVKIRPDFLDEYVRLHANVWPKVLEKITDCNIRNYSIYHYGDLLFSYYEYIGDDYEADMKKMADDPTTQEWWKVCTPGFIPVEQKGPNAWWTEMREIFHWD
ncbi:MAG TPA: L-rhamnose mutarotase [bacterium]|nr:L-rhamnose mutarotase [bacterium]HQL62166.1 L-rhamnose mutarotase [bacterium]